MPIVVGLIIGFTFIVMLTFGLAMVSVAWPLFLGLAVLWFIHHELWHRHRDKTCCRCH